MFKLGADGTDVDDGAFNNAHESVRKRRHAGRGSRMRLDCGAPCAEKQPEQREWNPEDSLCAKCGSGAERGYGDESYKRESGANPEPVRSENARGKQPRRVKQRNIGEACASWAFDGGSGAGRPGCHAAKYEKEWCDQRIRNGICVPECGASRQTEVNDGFKMEGLRK